jgi:hypothetical protein
MDFALSYEKTAVRLLVKPLKFKDLIEFFPEDQLFEINSLSILVEIPLKAINDCCLKEFKGEKGKNTLSNFAQNLLERYQKTNDISIIDFSELRHRLNLPGTTGENIVLFEFFNVAIRAGGLVNLKISCDALEIKYYEDINAYCFSFSEESKLKDFIENIPSRLHDRQYVALKEAVISRKLMATGEFKNKLKKTGVSNRIEAINRAYRW